MGRHRRRRGSRLEPRCRWRRGSATRLGNPLMIDPLPHRGRSLGWHASQRSNPFWKVVAKQVIPDPRPPFRSTAACIDGPGPRAGIHRVCSSRRSRKALSLSHPPGVLLAAIRERAKATQPAARTQPRGSCSRRRGRSTEEPKRLPNGLATRPWGRGRWRRPAAGRGTVKIRSAP